MTTSFQWHLEESRSLLWLRQGVHPRDSDAEGLFSVSGTIGTLGSTGGILYLYEVKTCWKKEVTGLCLSRGIFVPLPSLSVLSTATLSQGEQLSVTTPFYSDVSVSPQAQYISQPWTKALKPWMKIKVSSLIFSPLSSCDSDKAEYSTKWINTLCSFRNLCKNVHSNGLKTPGFTVLATIAEDLGLASSTHVVAPNSP